MEIIIIILILIGMGILLLTKSTSEIKKPAIKKEEIILQYEKELETILEQYKNNKNKQLEEKKKFLQRCNSELSRNIFFTEEESINIIKRLLQK